MIPDVGPPHGGSGVVGENRQPAFDAGDVVRRVIHQEVDILGESGGAVRDHGKSADEDITGAGLVQGSADADDVFGFWRSCVRRIISFIHVLASSKLANR